MIFVVVIISVLAVVALGAAIVVLVGGERGFGARVAALGQPAGVTRQEGQTNATFQRIKSFTQSLGKTLADSESSAVERGRLRERLIRAGFYSERAAPTFYAVRVFAAAGLGLLTVAVLVTLQLTNPLVVLFALMASATIGLFAPVLVIALMGRERVEQMKLALPDVMDLMVVCVEAGSTISSAMQRVEQELRPVYPVVSEQFNMALLEMQAGVSRVEALKRLADRVPADDLRAFVTLMAQSEALGASLGNTLRVFSEEMRRSRFIDAERRASELPVKMAFPLVFFIFPCLMGFIFTPVIIRFVRVLFQVGQ